jgi:hypothetical protein
MKILVNNQNKYKHIKIEQITKNNYAILVIILIYMN